MFYFLFVVYVFIIFIISRKDNRSSSRYLAKTLIALAFTILFLVLYLSKDTYYYNIVNNYFSLPKSVWKYFMFVGIPKGIIIKLLNASCLSVIYLGCRFSLSFLTGKSSRMLKAAPAAIAAILITQLIIYDPDVLYHSYVLLYPRFLSLSQINAAYGIIHTATVIINNTLIILSVLILFRVYKTGMVPHFFKIYILGEGICYTFIMLSYIMILWFSPTFLVKVSKIAGYVTYIPIHLNENRIIYTIFPYYLVAATVIIGFCLFRVVMIRKNIDAKDFSIARQIAATDTTFKVLCHYMKNELLAIHAGIELLDKAVENEEGINSLLERCDNLYQRLDVIHKSTRQSELALEEIDLRKLMTDIIASMKADLKDCTVITDFDSVIPLVIIDPGYFEQVVYNIITNALDAMEPIPVEKRKLRISIKRLDNWVMLSIEDTGIGIPEANIDHIFTPLFTSQPITRHWGIGLTLAYRIIHAHGGKIEVNSKVNVGTTFNILLPDIVNII